MAKKQIEVIDMDGKKTVAKKTSFVTNTKRVFAVVSILWIIFIAWFPLYVKNTYSGPIKKSMVVSVFFDLQRNIVKQYEALLGGIKKSINLEKPIGVAIEKVKIVENYKEDANILAKDKNKRIKRLLKRLKIKFLFFLLLIFYFYLYFGIMLLVFVVYIEICKYIYLKILYLVLLFL